MKMHAYFKKIIIAALGCCASTLIFAAGVTSVALPAPATLPAAVASNSAPTNVAAPVNNNIASPTTPAAPKLAANKAAIVVPTPPDIAAKGYILIDANSGYVIAEKNSSTTMAPASLTKLMTMYVVSAALKEGRIHLDDMVNISENAWRTGGSRMFVKVGSQVPVHDLINGIVVVSGNDACVAMSEFLSGSESSFVDIMNKMAAQLGMKNTHYADATGLPNPNNYTTPYDLTILSRSIISHYPEDYQWYSQKWMTYNNIRQPNRNLLLWRDPTVDGLKTGHTDDAGYCLVASAKRENMRLIAIIMGATSTKERANDAEALLTYGFRFFDTNRVYAQNTPLTQARAWFGKNKEISLGVGEDMYVTVPKGQQAKLQGGLIVNPDIKAPISKGQSYGSVQVSYNNQVIATQPLVALADNPMGGVFTRMRDHIALLFAHWFHHA